MSGLTLAVLGVLAGVSVGFMTLLHSDIRRLDAKFDAMNARFDGLQREVSFLRSDMGEVKGALHSLEVRVGAPD